MRILQLALITFLIPLYAFAQGGGGDADGGGGPDTTIVKLTQKGFGHSIFADLLNAMDTDVFSRDLLRRSGYLDRDVITSFDKVDFRKDGALVFNFQPKTEKITAPIVSPTLTIRPTNNTTLFNNFNSENVARLLGDSQLTGLNFNISTNSSGSPSNEKQEELSKQFEELLEKYSEPEVYKALDQIIEQVGAKIKAGEKKEFNLKALEQFYEYDLRSQLEESVPSIDLNRRFRTIEDIQIEGNRLRNFDIETTNFGNQFNF